MLLVQARDDPAAFARFYDLHCSNVLRFFAKRVPVADVAFDLMSETFAKVFENRLQFRGDSEEEEQGWMWTIARSELNRYWRRGSLERNALVRLGIAPIVLSDADIDRIEELFDAELFKGELDQAMATLPAEQSAAVRSRIVDGLGYDEIARASSVTQDVARARVSRGLRSLARDLRTADEDGRA